MAEEIFIKTFENEKERKSRSDFYDTFRECPLPRDEFLSNLGLFLNSKNLARILFMDFLYKQILDVHGKVFEFGVRWGQNISLFSALRGIYEPFNRHRKLVGFDTFKGFPGVAIEDGSSDLIKKGHYSVTKGYSAYLKKILDYHEEDNPLAHIKKYELREGDATVEIDRYLSENPETIVALAYFDLDIYAPTKKCLEAIKDRLTKGSVIAFDELCDHDCPGETLAVKEVLGLGRYAIKRYPYASRVSYIVVD